MFHMDACLSIVSGLIVWGALLSCIKLTAAAIQKARRPEKSQWRLK